MKKRIAINTGGGDAPGLNAVIRAVVVSALNKGWEVYGIKDGYSGIINPDLFPSGGTIRLTREHVKDITNLGGTILGTTNKGNPFSYPEKLPDGSVNLVDKSDIILDWFHDNKIDSFIAVGGDGSLSIASKFSEEGINVIGVPKTIDNDLDKTVVTFGFDTAVSFATDAVDRLHSTAQAHSRIMVVEVMGRYAGWIAMESGIAGSADVVLIPEIPYDINKAAAHIKNLYKSGRDYAIVVVAEGAKPVDGEVSVVEKNEGRAERLGGAGERVADQLAELTGEESRAVILGHLLRGGSPTAFDRLVSLRFGAAAVRALSRGMKNVMVALDPPVVQYVPLYEAVERMKTVPVECDSILTGRELGINFGD